MRKDIHRSYRRLAVLLAVLAMLAALPARALADDAPQGADTVEIGEDGTVTVLSDHMAGAMVSSLQVRVNVAALEGQTVGFAFDGGLSGRLTNFSYRDGALNIYAAGTAPLLAQGQNRLTLGVMSGADLASVQLPEDAVQFVYGKRVIAQSAQVQVRAAGPEDDADPGPEGGVRAALQAELDQAAALYGQDPAVKDRYTQDSWDALQSALTAAYDLLGDEAASEQDLQAALTALREALAGLKQSGRAALEQTLEQARGYDGAGYTQDSYGELQQAIRRAEEILADPDAGPEDWEEALGRIQEAVSRLVPVAGADGSGPVIADGADDGTGSGSAEPTPGAVTDMELLTGAEATETPAPTEAPSSTPEPTATAAPTANGRTASPDTGDEASAGLWMLILCLSGALLALLVRRQRG